MGKLTAAGVQAVLTKPGKYPDGEGLILFVRGPSKASWVARLQQNGKRRDFGLGSARLVTLAEARNKCRSYRRKLRAGLDPLASDRPEGANRLFRETALEFVKAKFPPDAQMRERRRLEIHAFPKLGRLMLRSLDADTIAEALRPIWMSKPDTAIKVRHLIIRTIRFGRSDGALLESTLAKAITDRLPTQPRKGRFEAAEYARVPMIMRKLEGKAGLGALAARAVILTAVRSGEVRGARWSELDLDKAVWTIPAERTKAKRIHRVPLSPEAVELFRHMARHRRADSEMVFPSAKGGLLSDMTLTKALRDLGEGVTVHGFRSSFRDWAAEQTSFPGEIPEAALAHAVPNAVEAAYRRTDFFDKRRELMDAWGAYCAGGTGATVHPIRAAAQEG